MKIENKHKWIRYRLGVIKIITNYIASRQFYKNLIYIKSIQFNLAWEKDETTVSSFL